LIAARHGAGITRWAQPETRGTGAGSRFDPPERSVRDLLKVSWSSPSKETMTMHVVPSMTHRHPAGPPLSLTQFAQESLVDPSDKATLAPQTLQEAAEMAARTGGPLFWRESVTSSFADPARLSDASLQEIAAGVSMQETAARVDAFMSEAGDDAVSKAVAALDRDGDGALDLSESAALDGKFQQWDADRDGLVTAKELATALRNDLGRELRVRPMTNPAEFAGKWIAALTRGESLTNSTATTMTDATRKVSSPGDSSVTETLNSVTKTASAASRRQRLQDVAHELSERLDVAGFDRRPPTNIRDLVRALDLQPQESSLVLRLLADRYPGGLGVSLYG
jgi:Ca2+-binding EF-hand superfamily protein